MHVRTPSVGTLGGLQTAPDVAKGPRREWRKPKPVMNGLKKSDAVPGSGRFIRAFHRRLQRLWMRALRRRSQRARFSWKRLERMTEILWPRASIRHPWPDQRFTVKHPR